MKPTETGWEADVEVLESERVPETAGVMATCRVTLDEGGDPMGCERERQYARGQTDRRG
ncbi:gas vesicle protein GvpO [Streptomyces sp. NPDC054770]